MVFNHYKTYLSILDFVFQGVFYLS